MNNSFYVKETDKHIDLLLADLKISIEALDFSIVHIHNMQEKYAKLGKQTGVATIVEICNPNKSFTAYSIDPKLLAMMPKTIDIFEEGGKLKVMFMRADKEKLGRLFPGTQIENMSQRVAKIMEEIIDKAVV